MIFIPKVNSGLTKKILHAKEQLWMTWWLNTVFHKSFMTNAHSLLFNFLYWPSLYFSKNLVTNSGIHSSLRLNCHHQIFFSNLNLNICYPPPHERLIWKYEKARANLIKRAVRDFDLENKLSVIGIKGTLMQIWKSPYIF